MNSPRALFLCVLVRYRLIPLHEYQLLKYLTQNERDTSITEIHLHDQGCGIHCPSVWLALFYRPGSRHLVIWSSLLCIPDSFRLIFFNKTQDCRQPRYMQSKFEFIPDTSVWYLLSWLISPCRTLKEYIDGLMQRRRNCSVLVMELCFFCIKPSIYGQTILISCLMIPWLLIGWDNCHFG